MRNEKVVVFGGSGFLGSHVSDALTEAGYQVTIFDRIQSSYLKPDQNMVIGDILDLDSVISATKHQNYIYNFAGLADIDDAKNRPLDTVRLNVLGNMNILEAARINNVQRFIFASSVYVYSEAGSFYRASKQSSERFVETYQERYGLNYTILRYGSLYGRRADMRNGIYRLLRQALDNKHIRYSGSSESMREYIHVADAARLSVQILGDEYVNRHLILTGQERMAVKNLMKMIAEMVQENITLEYNESPAFGHYIMTPYAFHPKIGHKLVATDYVDIGQGLLDCLAEIYENTHNSKHNEDDWLIADDEAKG